MNLIIGLLTGIIVQLIAVSAYNASDSEGFMTYLIGFGLGILISNNSEGKSNGKRN